jgi:hypothetical protein
MSETLFVMQYSDGAWVKRDDSTGPMSTGGYPYKAKGLIDATVWTSKEQALKYRHTCKSDGPWTLHRLELSTVPEVITPGDEAKASGDKDWEEFQRLAQKFGVQGTGECPFNKAWVGKCKKPPSVGEIYCDEHKKEKCWKCGAQATSDCSHAGQFVCGVPQCSQHSHHSGY